MNFKRSIIIILALVNLLGILVFLNRKNESNSILSKSKLANELHSQSTVKQLVTEQNTDPSHRQHTKKDPWTPDLGRLCLRNYDAKNKDQKGRSMVTAMVIEELCKNGYSMDAWSFIESGYGDARKNSLKIFFSEAKLDQDQMVGLIKKCDMKDDLSSALFGYFTRLTPEELVSVMSRPDMAEIMASSQKVGDVTNVNSWLSAGLQAANSKFNSTDSVISEAVMNLHSKGFLKPSDVMIISKYDTVDHVFEKWERLKTLTTEDKQEQAGLREKRDKVISNMIVSDAPKTLDKFLNELDESQIESNPEQAKDLLSAISSLNKQDAQAAANWYKKSRAGLTSKQQTLVSMSFMKEALDANELDGAKQWAEQVSDPEVRAKALKMLEERQHPTAP
jgi:hypothetical protein